MCTDYCGQASVEAPLLKLHVYLDCLQIYAEVQVRIFDNIQEHAKYLKTLLVHKLGIKQCLVLLYPLIKFNRWLPSVELHILNALVILRKPFPIPLVWTLRPQRLH